MIQEIRILQFVLLSCVLTSLNGQKTEGVLAPKPLYRDTIYDGAADPVVIQNTETKEWYMFYTNRRATETQLPGYSWVHGTSIGIAISKDGAHWTYEGTAQFHNLPEEAGGDSATFWAPDVIRGDDGLYHMYLTIVPGISEKWGLPAFISHFTSKDLVKWYFESALHQLGEKVIDAEVMKMNDGMWRMYFKGQVPPYSRQGMSLSKDLYTWSEPTDALKMGGEGPVSFYWKGFYWLVVDTWNGQTVFRSKDGNDWEKQSDSPLLTDGSGTGKDDIPNALHANEVIYKNRLYLFYFTHPGRVGDNSKKDGFEQRRTSIQVVELKLSKENWLTADRNSPTYINLGE